MPPCELSFAHRSGSHGRTGLDADVGEALLVLASVKRARGDETAAQSYAQRATEALANSLGQEHSLTRQANAMQLQPRRVN